MIRMFNIKSIRIEKHIQKISNNEFIEYEKNIFNCKDKEKSYEIELYYKYLNCGERNAIFKINEVKHFSGVSMVAKEEILIEIDENQKEIHNSIFDYNISKFRIYFDKFKSTNRLKKIRPVWILNGKSGLGKSYLSAIIMNNSDLTIYETDMSPELPEIIIEDIIVIGNKYKYSTEEIDSKIYGKHESIYINFTKSDNKD